MTEATETEKENERENTAELDTRKKDSREERSKVCMFWTWGFSPDGRWKE
jgi:hypothetical protein